MITHESYDHKYIIEDLNCVFPIDRMREYVQEDITDMKTVDLPFRLKKFGGIFY